jgi:hypothetical protein
MAARSLVQPVSMIRQQRTKEISMDFDLPDELQMLLKLPTKF